MVIFVIVMVAIALLSAIGFLVANRSQTEAPPVHFKRYVSEIKEQAKEPTPVNEDVVAYSPADVPGILHDSLSAVPIAPVEEAMMGCYGLMGAPGTTLAQRKQEVIPFRTNSLDEMLTRATMEITCMESDQHISKFTIFTHKISKTNPHVDLVAHSTEPNRIRLIRLWRTQDSYIASLPN
jgi:hypothetical protein